MINFTTLRWKNLLSTGNQFTEIKLNQSATTLVLGNNGSGKSTMLDALCFALFGKPFRKINKPNILNSINKSDGLVEVEFTIGVKNYKICRGVKPAVFEIYCNDELLNQDAKAKDYQQYLENAILKLNFKSFTQVVILGSASFVPFMQLSAADRREIIEDLLDIGIFSAMNTIVKVKLSSIKDLQTQNNYDTRLCAEKIDMQKTLIEEKKKNTQEVREKKQKESDDYEERIKELDESLRINYDKITALEEDISDRHHIGAKEKKMEALNIKFDALIRAAKDDIDFYHDNDNCPTCLQSIATDHKNSHVAEKQAKMEEYLTANKEVLEKLEAIRSRKKAIKAIETKITNLNNEFVGAEAEKRAIITNVKKLKSEIAALSGDSSNEDTTVVKLDELKDALKELVKTAKSLSEEKQYYDYTSVLLKDTGIKTKIIKQYLPIINKLVNKYLTAMDFFVNFEFDDSFNETIKSRHRDDFSYESFSEGEKMRIDLSLLFAWRQISKMKNSTNTNLLILDEVFDSSLDNTGTEEFLKLLNTLDKNINVFVISHKGDQLFDKFENTIKFVKKNNFSQIEKQENTL